MHCLKDGQRRIAACYNDGIRVGDDGALRFTNDYLEKTPFRSRVVGSVFRVWFNWRLSREAMVGDVALLNPAVTRYEPAWAMANHGRPAAPSAASASAKTVLPHFTAPAWGATTVTR